MNQLSLFQENSKEQEKPKEDTSLISEIKMYLFIKGESTHEELIRYLGCNVEARTIKKIANWDKRRQLWRIKPEHTCSIAPGDIIED